MRLIIVPFLLVSLNVFAQSEQVVSFSDEVDPVKAELVHINRYMAEIEEKLKDEPIEAKKVYLSREMKYETVKKLKKRDMEIIKRAPIMMREKTDIIEIKFDKII